MFTKLTDHLLDESHHLFRDTCVRFAQREILPYAEAWEEAEGFPRELFSRVGATGILGAELPEAYGGGGGDMAISPSAAAPPRS